MIGRRDFYRWPPSAELMALLEFARTAIDGALVVDGDGMRATLIALREALDPVANPRAAGLIAAVEALEVLPAEGWRAAAAEAVRRRERVPLEGLT